MLSQLSLCIIPWTLHWFHTYRSINYSLCEDVLCGSVSSFLKSEKISLTNLQGCFRLDLRQKAHFTNLRHGVVSSERHSWYVLWELCSSLIPTRDYSCISTKPVMFKKFSSNWGSFSTKTGEIGDCFTNIIISSNNTEQWWPYTDQT